MCSNGSSRRSRSASIADISARMALAEMSEQLAPIAPGAAFRRPPPRQATIESSLPRPVLQESARLSEDDLVEIAETKGEQHLLAVSARWWLKRSRHRRAVGPPLSARQPADRQQSGRAGFRRRVCNHRWRRRKPTPNLPSRPASGSICPRSSVTNSCAVRRKRSEPGCCRARRPSFEEIRNAIATVAAGADREMSKVRDFTAAKRFVAKLKENGRLNEATCPASPGRGNMKRPSRPWPELSQSTIEVNPPADAKPARRRPSRSPAGRRGSAGRRRARCWSAAIRPDSMGPAELAKAKSQFAKMTVRTRDACSDFWQSSLVVLAGTLN